MGVCPTPEASLSMRSFVCTKAFCRTKTLLRTQRLQVQALFLSAECLWQEGPSAHLLKERHLLHELPAKACIELLA
jgi:hypothetical protein